jgi:transcriptional regulator
MYIPRRYLQGDTAVAHDLIQTNVFATLITEVSGRLDAAHVPVVLDPERGSLGSLRFHLAAVNPTARALADRREILMVFTGPHTYISPDWYANDNLVPTWNYAVVHAYGTPRVMDDADLRRLLDDLSAAQEAHLPKTPWTVAKMPADLVDKMCDAIVGFDMPIAELQSKWKFSQNRGADDRAGVITALEDLGGESNSAVAATMRSLD